MPHERIGMSWEYMKQAICFNHIPQALRHTDKKDQKEKKHHKAADDKSSKARCRVCICLPACGISKDTLFSSITILSMKETYPIVYRVFYIPGWLFGISSINRRYLVSRSLKCNACYRLRVKNLPFRPFMPLNAMVTRT